VLDLEEKRRRGYQAKPQRSEECRARDAASRTEGSPAVTFTSADLRRPTSSGRLSY
jgi:hypothetical protein